VTFWVYVQPRARQNEIAGRQGDALKLRLMASPVDGAANEACRLFLAHLFQVRRDQVEILKGQTARRKLIRIRHADPGMLKERLATLVK
jgi:uncharacterized protein (TIGR00251 family)